MQSVKFNDSFYLTIKDLKKEDEPTHQLKPQPTNFIFVIDVSGSMSYDLTLIRKQMKNKLPNLIKDGDTVTIIWFSGKNESGILMEEVEIKSLKSLQDINNSIDRFLKPICLTAFAKPLVLAKEAIERIRKNRDGVFSMVFLTDGYNNDCSWNDVMSSLKNLENDLAASTFVEYGYYADSRAISKMAEVIGGEKIEAERFDDYDIIFENKIQKTYSSAKKVVVDLPTNRKFDFAFTMSDDGEIIIYSVNNDQVLLPETTKSVMLFTTSPVSNVVDFNGVDTRLLYGGVYVLSEKLQNEYVDDVFRVLGDVRLYNIFVNAYGKQKLMSFKSLVKECAYDTTKQFQEGRSTNIIADENAYCVMDFINDLTNDENALIYPMHEDFNYKRIGAKKEVKINNSLNEEVKNKIANASTKEEIQEILDEVKDEVKLDFQYNDKSKGYSIDGLVWSSERANLSIRIKYDGYVNLPENNFGLDKIDTFIYRTYTIIKDGILNLSTLPVSLSFKTVLKFKGLGLDIKLKPRVDDENVTDIYIIDFSSLPVVNKKMVKSISAKQLGLLEYELFESKALEKVYKHYENQLGVVKSKEFVEKYGSDATEWLKELGITEFNGFAPSLKSVDGSDFYMAVELVTKMALHSSLPTVQKVIDKGGQKLNAVEQIMQIAIDDYNNVTNSSLYTSLSDDNLKKEVIENWLKTVKLKVKTRRKELLNEIAKIKFALILSKKWFNEFTSFEENSLTLDVSEKKTVNFTFELKESEVSL